MITDLDNILSMTAEVCQVPASDITAEPKRGNNIEVRQMFCTMAYELGYTFEDIGKYLHRDHSTIMHSRTKFLGEVIGYSPRRKEQYYKIKEKINNLLAEYYAGWEKNK